MVIDGFLLRSMGDNTIRDADLKIDNQKFTLKCEVNPTESKKGGRDNRCYFRFNIPPKFMDGKEHHVMVYDNITGNLIADKIFIIHQSREYNDFSGFLSSSYSISIN